MRLPESHLVDDHVSQLRDKEDEAPTGTVEQVRPRALPTGLTLQALVKWEGKEHEPNEWVWVLEHDMPDASMRADAWAMFKAAHPAHRSNSPETAPAVPRSRQTRSIISTSVQSVPVDASAHAPKKGVQQQEAEAPMEPPSAVMQMATELSQRVGDISERMFGSLRMLGGSEPTASARSAEPRRSPFALEAISEAEDHTTALRDPGLRLVLTPRGHLRERADDVQA